MRHQLFPALQGHKAFKAIQDLQDQRVRHQLRLAPQDQLDHRAIKDHPALRDRKAHRASKAYRVMLARQGRKEYKVIPVWLDRQDRKVQ